MPLIARLWDATGGALLLRSGRAGWVTTPGRVSGQLRTVPCGYLSRSDGTILVGSADGRHWPRNLAAAGWCLFRSRELEQRRYVATVLDGAQRGAALDDFRRARGDRAAAMLSGPVFELRPSHGDYAGWDGPRNPER